jgi:formylglycine-generating enzyme required for sulfatase activity/serine/threonine protein kinase/Flp pilus assembly protein TadD
MGVVFHGFDPAIGRPVAIKIIQASQFTSALEDAEFKLRFAREAAAAGRLSHPNIVTVYQFGEESGVRYLVQELVKGRSLEQMLSNNLPQDRNTTVSILSQVADALDYAHAEGVVHRDIKPANILVRPDGRVKITDFGIAHIASETVTGTGRTLGTPAYMSPEQITSARVSGKTDQFSLAVTAYQMLSGIKPFAADSSAALMYQIVSEEPQPLHATNPAVSPRTSEVIRRALAKRPDDRFARCTEFAERLAESMNAGGDRAQHYVAAATMRPPVAAPERKRRISPVLLWAAAGLAVVGLAVAVWVRGRGPSAQPGTTLLQKSDTNTLRSSQTEPIAQPQKMADTGPRAGTPSAPEGKSDVPSKLMSGKAPSESASNTEVPPMGEKVGTLRAPPAKAATPVTIFSDLTGTSTPGGYVVGQYSPGRSFALGAAFTPVGSNYALDQLKSLLSGRSEQNLMIVDLHNDVGGAPGLLLESWQIDVGSAPAIVTLNSVRHPTLIAGQQYWITVGMADPASRGAWWINHIGGLCCGAPGEVQGMSTDSLNGAPFKRGTVTTAGFHAFEVTGSVVSPPDTKSPSVEKKAATPAAPEDRESLEPRAGATKVNSKDRLTYMWIPPGTFTMGCSPGDSECYGEEMPAHAVTITRGFWLGQTDVTQAAYQRVIGSNPSYFKGDNLPVETVTWDQAKGYCQAIGGRLPTEAEWEYAARAGTTAVRYGNLDDIAWYSSNSGGKTHEVGQKKPNAFGLYDMLGNVWQWTADWYANYPASEARDPSGALESTGRVLRGGSCLNGPRNARLSGRNGGVAGGRRDRVGLRCVEAATPTAATPLAAQPSGVPAPAGGSSPTADARAAEVKNAQGLQMLNQRKYAEAIATFTEAIRLNPDFAEAYFDRCRAYGSLSVPSMISHSVEDCDKAIQLKPDFGEAYHYRGRAYAAQQLFQRAIQDYDEALRLESGSGSIYTDRGFLYAAQNKPDLAIKEYDELIRMKPNDSYSYFARAREYNRQRRPELAIQDCNESIRLNSKFLFAYTARGDAYRLQNKYDLAIQDYDEAIRLQPNYAEAYTGRAAAKASLGDKAGAAADRQRAQELSK